MASVDWLWGALAGATAALAGAELRERLKHRRTIDGAAIDFARVHLQRVSLLHIRLERSLQIHPEYIEDQSQVRLGDLVTADLRDQLRQATDEVKTRVGDCELSDVMRTVYKQFGHARDVAREYDVAQRTAERWDFIRFRVACDEILLYVGAAQGQALLALERMAQLERERPRR